MGGTLGGCTITTEDGASPTSKATYVREAEQLCRKAEDDSIAIIDSIDPNNPSDARSLLPRLLKVDRRFLRDFRALPPPRKQQHPVRLMEKLAGQMVAEGRDLTTALQRRDRPAFLKSMRTGFRLSERFRGVARSYGLNDCASTAELRQRLGRLEP